jgi:hypothetical protein
MPKVNVTGIGKINFPDNMTPSQIADVIETQIIPQHQEHLAKTGFIPALKSGVRSFIAGTEETLGFKEAGAEQRRKAEEAYQPFTEEDLAAAKERGVFDAIGAYKTKYLTEPLGGIVGRYGAPVVAGMLAPEAGIGAIGGAALRGLAGTAVDLPAEKAENIQAQIAAGKPVNEINATLAAIPQALLAGFGFPGTTQLNKVLAPRLLAEAEAIAPRVVEGQLTLDAAKAQLTNKTKEYLANMGVNTAAGAGLMIGTEDIRRLQAGQPLMSGQEMLESVVQAGVLSPVFGLLHRSQRPKAEAILKEASGKYEKIQNELADLRALAETREFTRQENIRKSELEEEARRLAKEMERRIPLTKQDVLPFEATTEEAKAEQLKGEAQKDLFTEAAETRAPVKTETITPETFTSLDIGNTARIRKEITGLDLYDREQNKIIRDKLQAYLDKYGSNTEQIQKIETLIDKAKSISDTLPLPKGEENVPAAKTEPAGDRTSVSGVDVGRFEDTTRATTADVGRMDVSRDDVGQYPERERQQPLALEEQKTPETTEVLKGEKELIAEEALPIEEKKPIEETAPKEEPIPLFDEAKKVAAELKALDPKNPYLDTLRDLYNITDRDIADAKAEAAAIREERAGKGKTTLAEEKEIAAVEPIRPKVEEARDVTKSTGQTKETVMYRLKGIFGGGIDNLTKRNVLNVVNSVGELPENIRTVLGADAIGAHSEGKAYIIADRLSPENIRRVALHEIGEHYGLEAMVGERNYKDILQSVAAGKDKDAIIKAGWEHVTKTYPELTVGSRQFLREIVAKIGEDAPSHPLWRRIINAVRNFLKVNKYKNLTGEEIQDLVMHSFKTAMKKDLKQVERKGVEFAKKQEPNPEFKAVFERAGGVYETPKEPTLFQSIKDNPVNFVKEQAKVAPKFLDKFETMWFSSDAALQNAIRKGMENMGMSFDQIKQMLFRASTSQALHREALAHQVLEKGGLKYDPESFKYVAIDKPGSWKGVIDALKTTAERNGLTYEEMEKYAHQALVARRLRGIKERKLEAERVFVRELAEAKTKAERDAAEAKFDKTNKLIVHLNEQQLAAGEQLFNKIKGMDTVVKEWNKTRENILDFAVESGLYTKSEAETLLDVMDYVPFYRVEQLENRAGPREFNRGLLDVATDKRFIGSKQPVNNVFDNMERWISYVVRKGVGNQSAKDLNEAAMKYLPEGEVRLLDKNEKIPHDLKGNVVGIWSNGSVDRYVYTDPLFVHAFTGMEPIVIPALSAASKFTNLLRQNIVLNPLFSIGQLSQDAFGAMFVSGVKHPFALPAQVMKEFISTLRGTSEAQAELKKYGAVGVRDYSSAVSRIDAEIAAGLKDPKLMDKLSKPFRALSMASDNAVRQAIYNQTLKETGNKALAIERAFEVINFRRSGASSTVNFLRQTVPFFGAYLQSMNVAAKVIAGKGIAPMEKAEARKVLASTFAKVLVAGFIYNVLISEDEDYKKLDTSVRDKKLLIPGSGGLSLPVRGDIFTLVSKILPEHIYQMTMVEGTEDGTKAKKALYNGLANALLGPNVLPQFGKPVLEVMTNYNFFTDRPIVGQGLEELQPQYQYSVNTSELSKVMGTSMGVSPMKIDHLLKAYFGYTAGLGLMATDQVMSAASGKALPDKSFEDTVASIPGMSAFVAKEFGTKDKSDFYELRTLVNEAVKSSNYLKAYKTAEERKEFISENQKLLQVKTQVNAINKQLTDIRRQERLVFEAPDTKMSPAQKEAKIRALREREQLVLRNIRELRLRAGL